MGVDEPGITPIERVSVNAVHWTKEAEEHIRTRTTRYPDRHELDLQAEWATQAALDPLRLVAETGGLSIEVVGWSRSAPPRLGEAGGRLLKVWLIPSGEKGVWVGVSACAANRSERRAYEERNYGQGNG